LVSINRAWLEELAFYFGKGHTSAGSCSEHDYPQWSVAEQLHHLQECKQVPSYLRQWLRRLRASDLWAELCFVLHNQLVATSQGESGVSSLPLTPMVHQQADAASFKNRSTAFQFVVNWMIAGTQHSAC